MTHKAIIFFIFLNLLFANENISKAKEIMEKVISHPSPTTSISEIKLEIVRKRGSRIASNIYTVAKFRYNK